MQNKTVKSHKIRNIKTLRCTKNKYSEKNIKKKKKIIKIIMRNILSSVINY